MKKRWIILSMLAVLTVGGIGGTVLGVATTQVAVARGELGPLGRLISGQIARWRQLGSALNLTADQRQQIRGIVESHRAEIAEVVKPLVEKRRALGAATSGGTMDEPAIRAAAADLTQSVGDAAVLAAKIKLEVRQVLTPTQTQQIEEFRRNSDAAVDQFVQELSNP
jgi:Spy/CpxP family protein refolding chaperone